MLYWYQSVLAQSSDENTSHRPEIDLIQPTLHSKRIPNHIQKLILRPTGDNLLHSHSQVTVLIAEFQKLSHFYQFFILKYSH